MLGDAGLVGKVLERVAQRLCKSCNEGAAARGASLIDFDAIDDTLVHEDSLHVLSADV